MTCGTYEILNKETNQCYIGRSINIENRWKGHLCSPSGNMAPTIELFKKCPEMVELNILLEIDETHFDNDELKFITSVCELYEINQRGGWESEDLLNGRDGEILACPPSILSKRELLPSCISLEDIAQGIEKWNNTVYRYSLEEHSIRAKGMKTYEESYWKIMYFQLREEFDELKKGNIKLSFREQQELHSLKYREKMKVDYEYYKLKKSILGLQDELDALQSTLDFWKGRCNEWRNKFFELEKEVKL